MKIHDRMAGKFLAFAGISKEAIHVVSVGSGERVFDTPDLLEHQIGALAGIHFACPFAGFFRDPRRLTRGWPESFSRLLVSAKSLSKS